MKKTVLLYNGRFKPGDHVVTAHTMNLVADSFTIVRRTDPTASVLPGGTRLVVVDIDMPLNHMPSYHVSRDGDTSAVFVLPEFALLPDPQSKYDILGVRK